MSSTADKGRPAARRRYDAQASRQALLEAATELFDARGYDATTTREIGERAGTDPALIARYFGGKEGLYLATVAEAAPPEPATDPYALVERVLRKSETRGLGPIARATVSATLTDAMREQVRDILAARTVRPLAATLQGAGDPELRAEVLVAMALGLSLARAGGTLPRLRDAELDEVLDVLAPAVGALCAERG
ncbi:MAG: TetR family transcriptional regulator [Solirubrobacterales bacterium]|nr:TetR family transcriptional regulator [Solirubrobacterales bacterium]